MSVRINGVCGAAKRARIKKDELLVSINGHEIEDVLDYRFFELDSDLELRVADKDGRERDVLVRKKEGDELGLLFDSYLIDRQHSCKNKCIFCFIDQLPKGMRDTLYFKDDDSRLSFLFGNYITLTNLSEHEVERIISMHISPVNVSVHTTNPELRVRMMKNKHAGESLALLDRFAKAGISMNCQLVLCPGINDGYELERSLNDLLKYDTVQSIACVPVGLTKYRDGLEHLDPFNTENAAAVLDIVDRIGDRSVRISGARRVFASDEFYILSGRPIPPAEYYEEMLQLENGVGMWALFREEAKQALSVTPPPRRCRHISIATGAAAYPLIKEAADEAQRLWPGFRCEVYEIKNNFFGEKITVTGLLTGKDVAEQLAGLELGQQLLLSDAMLRREGDVFLDDMTPKELSRLLKVKIKMTNCRGDKLIAAMRG